MEISSLIHKDRVKGEKMKANFVIEEKLKSLGITLPNPPKPAGSYLPVVKAGNLVFV